MPRYIDADKLIEELQPAKNLEWNKNDHYKSKSEMIEDFCTELENAHTADVQEVRHGRWMDDKETGYLICSECGRFTDEIIGHMIVHDGIIIRRSMPPFYCSKCGAKMDG